MSVGDINGAPNAGCRAHPVAASVTAAAIDQLQPPLDAAR
jgi:hypothetical protein